MLSQVARGHRAREHEHSDQHHRDDLEDPVSHVPDLHGAVPRMLVNRTADVHDTLAVVGM